MTPVLSVRSVGFPARSGMLMALDRVSFETGRGEILGMVGESGAGKSMAGASLIGLIAPPGRITGGTVELGGTRIEGLDDHATRAIRCKRIGSIFQDPMTSLDPLHEVIGGVAIAKRRLDHELESLQRDIAALGGAR